MSAQHTQEPWIAEFMDDIFIRGSGGKIVAVIPPDSSLFGDLETRKANGRLITAAPELLEALEKALASFQITQKLDLYTADHWCNLAHAAIAKAKGGQQ